MKQVRLKDISSLIMGQSVDNENINDQNIGLEFHQGNSNFYNNYVKKSFIYSVSGKKSINKDILISVRAPVGELSINDRDLYIGRGLAAIRVKPICFYKFIQYFILGNKDLFYNIEKGTTFKSITTFDLKNISIAIPHLQIQTAIANYLDYHTTKIDSEISYLEKKSSLLEEYKQSLIFETVTKGLDKSVSMKDSGIDWIGEIPVHWEVKRVKDIAKISTGQTPDRKKEDYFTQDASLGTLWVKPEDLNYRKITSSSEYITSKGLKYIKTYNAKSIIFSGIGEVGKIGICLNTFTTNQQNHIIYNIKDNYLFLYYYLIAAKKYIQNFSTGNVVSILNANRLGYILSITPCHNEQTSIANYLDYHTAKIDKQRELMKKKIELLKEYKQSLIYEAVTGKIEIPQEFYKETL